jgi:hypothetical protein
MPVCEFLVACAPTPMQLCDKFVLLIEIKDGGDDPIGAT